MSELRAIRKAQGMTAANVGQAIGREEASVHRYEREDHRLTLPLMRQLAAVLDCSIAQIAGDEPFPATAARKARETKLRACVREVLALSEKWQEGPWKNEEIVDLVAYLFFEAPDPDRDADEPAETIRAEAAHAAKVIKFGRSR
ncbi:MAG: helix-turn-helix transcriptional regulator [Sphingomonadales bacterium]|nr:helix-turn-helix transcriptional regulator [Sphingomonadales bacterium]